ncbi:uncharacterized protein LOC129616952 [Condylostylus longicornis]|uniref:uncharacterized protein LOC129616952 n=1 Tax=Condylostylus longicornis TaxID=2530218 RepID=UPI00244E05D5|nr:uncharacterized protein LOC129616952 [Condylostylus longicornis]
MYNGIGLPTARGSGTSGYIQRNLSYLKPRRSDFPSATAIGSERYFDEEKAPKVKKANAELLQHEKRRKVEVQLVVFSDELKSKGLEEEEMEKLINLERERLLGCMAEKEIHARNKQDREVILGLDTHQLAALKDSENRRLRDALDLDRKKPSSKPQKSESFSENKKRRRRSPSSERHNSHKHRSSSLLSIVSLICFSDMHVFQELQHLHSFFSDRSRRRRRLAELYESVQHAGNVLPRLYLLVCVGAACIREREIAPHETLVDLNELCKGVQHPLRGLFLRYFLVQMVKGVLPDRGDSDYPDWPGGSEENPSSTDTSFEFLFNNCVEATKLWTRVQFQPLIGDKTKKENDRHSLRVLVGANLVCMAQLDGVTVNFYQTLALPKLLTHINGLRDVMAQQYLLECVVQVFSDECHLATLKELMDGINAANSSVDIKVIFSNLFSRLKTFLTSDSFGNEEEPALEKAAAIEDSPIKNEQFSTLPEPSAESPSEAVPDLPDVPNVPDVSNVPEVSNVEVLNLPSSPLSRPDEGSQVLLEESQDSSIPFAQLPSSRNSRPTSPDFKRVSAALSAFTTIREGLMDLIQKAYDEDFRSPPPKTPTKPGIARDMVAALLKSDEEISDPSVCDKLYSLLHLVIASPKPNSSAEAKEWVNEVENTAALCHLIKDDDTDLHFSMLLSAKQSLLSGHPDTIHYTIPAVVTCLLSLIPRIQTRSDGASEPQSGPPSPQAATQHPSPQISPRIDHSQSAPQSSVATPTLPSVSVRRVLQQVHGTCVDLIESNPDLAFRLLLLAAEATAQANQSASEDYRVICNEESRCEILRVLECLQRCLKLATDAVQFNVLDVTLFVDIFEKYLFYFEGGPDVGGIPPESLTSLLALCSEQLAFAESSSAASSESTRETILASQRHLANTVDYIRTCRDSDVNSKFHRKILYKIKYFIKILQDPFVLP